MTDADVPAPVDRPRWDGAVSAGLGAGFGYILFAALVKFGHAHWHERIEDLVAMALVAVGIIKFLEPLVGRLRRLLGVTEERVHVPVPARSRRLVRAVVFVTLMLASVSHALLHDMIKVDPSGVIGILLVALLIPGGITYAWLVGARKDPPRAARYGAVTGALAGALHLFIVFVVLAALTPLGTDGPRLAPLHELEQAVLLNGLAWGALGLAGGLAIDRLKGPRPAWSVAGALVLIALLLDLVALRFPDLLMYGPADFAKIIGWGLGLMAYPRSNRLFMVARREAPPRAP